MTVSEVTPRSTGRRVTTISCGNVWLKLNNGKLKKTIRPSPSDLSKFYTRGVTTGSGLDMLYTRSRMAARMRFDNDDE
jgi:hypothetical protein